MNTTEGLITTGCPAVAPQPMNKVIKPIKFPAQPQEWKIVSLRECPTPENVQQCETPDQAAAYWKSHIADHPYFNPECECLVVFILNTRRRIKGHYLVFHWHDGYDPLSSQGDFSIGSHGLVLLQSSSRITIRVVIRLHLRRTSKLPVISFERVSF